MLTIQEGGIFSAPRTYLPFFGVLMTIKFALLIDGGFLRRRLRAVLHDDETFAAAVSRFINGMGNCTELRDLSLYRTFYYDAEPYSRAKEKPLNGGMEYFSKSVEVQKSGEVIRDLRRLPFVAVRLGNTDFRGWRVKPQALPIATDQVTITSQDLVADIQQKGVDMRIGLDVAALSLKKFADVIVLVSGDSDFIPVLKFARTEGRQVFLFTLGHRIKEELRAHADVCVDSPLANIISK